jgi:hypothetical protein
MEKPIKKGKENWDDYSWNELHHIAMAAQKLVRCKGRYHAEQNYRSLAALFGVTVPTDDGWVLASVSQNRWTCRGTRSNTSLNGMTGRLMRGSGAAGAASNTPTGRPKAKLTGGTGNRTTSSPGWSCRAVENNIAVAMAKAREIYAKTGTHQCLVQHRDSVAIFPHVCEGTRIMWTTRNDKAVEHD